MSLFKATEMTFSTCVWIGWENRFPEFLTVWYFTWWFTAGVEEWTAYTELRTLSLKAVQRPMVLFLIEHQSWDGFGVQGSQLSGSSGEHMIGNNLPAVGNQGPFHPFFFL